MRVTVTSGICHACHPPIASSARIVCGAPARTAIISSIEQDYDDRVHLAVTVDDDPGHDLGASGKPGHRFFFRPEEVEPLEAEGRGDS